jgi:hypothetical protein
MSATLFPWFAVFVSPFFKERTADGDTVFTSIFEKSIVELGFSGQANFTQIPPLVDLEYLPQTEEDLAAGRPPVLMEGGGKPRYPITIHLARFPRQQMIVDLDNVPEVWRISAQRTLAEINTIEANLRRMGVEAELNKATTTEQMAGRIAAIITDFKGFPAGWFG